jgi:hypothetical protein
MEGDEFGQPEHQRGRAPALQGFCKVFIPSQDLIGCQQV